jgi:D-alanyl-D-alanine carboxypeptidase/D-alanyl-D-alanine-endopeptidase (penicillin-binding protein 4)
VGKRHSRIQLILTCFLVGLAVPLPRLPRVCSAESIREILGHPDNKQTRFGVHFCDPLTGKTVFDHNADVPLIPASNMKLLTTAAALEQLGADFIYETVFALSGEDLVIIAGGDPLTGDPILAERDKRDVYTLFQNIYEQLQKRKIKVIRGNLLIDDFIFDDQRYHPSWERKDTDDWYAAQVSGLCFNDNCIDITVAPAAQRGQPVLVTSTPTTSYVTIINKCRTITSGAQSAKIHNQVSAKTITLTGKVRYQQSFKSAPVERPSAYFGHVLAEYLLQHGIQINGKLIIKQLRDDRGRLPGDLEVIYTHQTPMKDVLVRANRDSLNLAAECLFKTLGAYHDLPADSVFQCGSWPRGRAAVIDLLDKLDIAAIHYEIDDGSGLSRHNQVSARCLTAILGYMFDHAGAELFRRSLATPSSRGTLKNSKRFQEDSYHERIQAKTGYLNGVWACSGYARKQTGDWLVFSILASREARVKKGQQSPRVYIDRMVKAAIDN